MGGLICLDKAVNGALTAYEDGFTLLELTRISRQAFPERKLT